MSDFEKGPQDPEKEKNIKREEMRVEHSNISIEDLRELLSKKMASLERARDNPKMKSGSPLLQKLELEAELLADIIEDRETGKINKLYPPLG